MTKTALVIGGSSDIGSEIVKKLSEKYKVYYTYCNTDRYDLPAEGIYCDITNTESVDSIFEEIESLDLLVTSAFPFIETDMLDFEGYVKMEKFLRGHIQVITKASQMMNRGARIINILGQSVDCGLPSAPHYGASFAYIDNLSKSINAVYGREGRLSVHNILLGPVNTRLWADVSSEDKKLFEKNVIKFIEPSQVASDVFYIAEAEVAPTKFVLDGFYSLPK